MAEHFGDILRVAMIASAVALIALGSHVYGGAVLAAITYEAIDNMGWVPRKISLFMETYMPAVAYTGMLIGGSLVSQIFAATMLMTAFPLINRFCLKQVDSLARRIFNLNGPALNDIDAPVSEKKNLSFEAINQILDRSEHCFEIDFKHCSKWVTDLSKLPVNRNFAEFQTLFDTISWKDKYSLVRAKLKDDERFIDLLKEKNPGVKTEELKLNFDLYIGRLAEAEKLSKEQYASNVLRQQMAALVSTLEGKRRVRGCQSDLVDAMDSCSKILPYLKTLDPVKDRVEIEDFLLKLAIEGGDYCARGIKRATSELISSMLQKDLTPGAHLDDPLKDYESKIRRALQEKRFEIVQGKYNNLANMLLKQFPDAIRNDIHVFDM